MMSVLGFESFILILFCYFTLYIHFISNIVNWTYMPTLLSTGNLRVFNGRILSLLCSLIIIWTLLNLHRRITVHFDMIYITKFSFNIAFWEAWLVKCCSENFIPCWNYLLSIVSWLKFSFTKLIFSFHVGCWN